MNQRIRELAKAYLVHERYTRYGEIVEEDLYEFYPDELEQFAELIVRECVGICNKIYFDRYPDAEDYERSEEGDAIKEHFGVEP